MASLDIPRQRLYNQRLIGPKFQTPAQVAAHFGAVQAQDYAGAKWAMAQRTHGLTDADLDRALADGSILRTHVLRPTWHFVIPADIRWMLSLTAPRIKAACAYQWRRLRLDEALFKRSNAVLVKALRDGPLTRSDLAVALARAGVLADGEQRLSHLLMRAELDGLICSGGRRGKQFTYALLDERAPEAGRLTRDEALSKLAVRYFSGHGPATIQDFAWWSGLTLTDARRGLAMVQAQLQHEAVGDQTYWLVPADDHVPTSTPLLLPNFDEYIVGYADRSAIYEAAHTDKLDARNNVLFMNTLLIDGCVVGTWQRTLQKTVVVIDLKPFKPLSKTDQRAVARAADRFGAFLGLPIVWA